MASIFTRIINGEIPSYKISENESCYAFLDINPLAKGHTLVVPKLETDNIFDLDDLSFRELFSFARSVGQAISRSIPSEKVGIAVIGLEVRHAHIHLVPINGIYDIDFSKPKLQLSKEEFDDIARTIRSNLR